MSSSTKVKPQTFSTGLYGSATTNKYGTTYDPSAFEKKLVNMTSNYVPQYLEQLVNPTYNSEVFQAQTAQRNRLANQSFENNVINPLASRGLTRGSSINQMSNRFANKLADLEVDAMAQEDTRNANMVDNLMSYYQVPYNMMNDVSTFSSNQYQQAYQNALLDSKNQNSSLNNIAGMLGNVSSAGGSQPASQWGNLLGAGAGYYLGGPAGAQIGSAVGRNLGGLF